MTEAIVQNLSVSNVLNHLLTLQNKTQIQQFNDNDINAFVSFQKTINDPILSQLSETRSQLAVISSTLLVIAETFVKSNSIYLNNSGLAALIEKHKRTSGVITSQSQVIAFMNSLFGSINLTKLVANAQIIGITPEQKDMYLNIYDGLKKRVYSQIDVINLMATLNHASRKFKETTTDEFIIEKLKGFELEQATIAQGGDKFVSDVKRYIRIILELNGIQLPVEEA